MPASGRLDRRVVIRRKTVQQDGTGQPIETWVDWKVAMMSRRDLRADERFRAGQDLGTMVAVWTCHFFPGLGIEDRLIADGPTWDIIGIAELGRRSGLEITAVATGV